MPRYLRGLWLLIAIGWAVMAYNEHWQFPGERLLLDVGTLVLVWLRYQYVPMPQYSAGEWIVGILLTATLIGLSVNATQTPYTPYLFGAVLLVTLLLGRHWQKHHRVTDPHRSV